MDKGYHAKDIPARCEAWGIRTYIPEPKGKRRKWKDKPMAFEQAYRANRRRVRTSKGRRLNRKRSFAHVCETGGGRRSWLRGIENVIKAQKLKCAAFNLGLLMREVFGLRKPRNWEEGRLAALAALFVLYFVVLALPGTVPWDQFGKIVFFTLVTLTLWENLRRESDRVGGVRKPSL